MSLEPSQRPNSLLYLAQLQEVSAESMFYHAVHAPGIPKSELHFRREVSETLSLPPKIRFNQLWFLIAELWLAQRRLVTRFWFKLLPNLKTPKNGCDGLGVSPIMGFLRFPLKATKQVGAAPKPHDGSHWIPASTSSSGMRHRAALEMAMGKSRSPVPTLTLTSCQAHRPDADLKGEGGPTTPHFIQSPQKEFHFLPLR